MKIRWQTWVIAALAVVATAAIVTAVSLFLSNAAPPSNAPNPAPAQIAATQATPEIALPPVAPDPAQETAAAPLVLPVYAAPPVSVPQPAPSAGVPPAIMTAALVRNTMLAVDQANKTGNYTVLRDLGSPDFRNTNDAARLAQIFATLKAQGVDLLAVAVADPVYKEAPRLTDKQMLYVAGTYAIAPRAITFELLFENVAGQWRIYGVSIVPV